MLLCAHKQNVGKTNYLTDERHGELTVTENQGTEKSEKRRVCWSR